MKKRELAPGIVVYSNVIEGYSDLITDIEDGAKSAGIDWIQSAVGKENDIEVDKLSRDTMTIVVGYDKIKDNELYNFKEAFESNLSNLFLSSFSSLELDYKSDYQLETIWHDDYSILKYGEGQKFVNHIDDHKLYHRRLSLVYYINDNYLGGEIVFPRFGITYKPAANELLLFPSAYVYNHSVLPVIEGTRYSVVSWLK